MIEIVRAEQWLFETMTGDSELMALLDDDPLRVCQYVAGKDSEFPVVIYQLQTSTDLTVQGGMRVWADSTFLVKAVGQTASSDDLSPIVDRIDELFSPSRGGAAGDDGLVLGSVREQSVSYDEIANSKRFRHIGGIYRLWAQ